MTRSKNNPPTLSTLRAALGDAYRIDHPVGPGGLVTTPAGFSVGWIDPIEGELTARICVAFELDTGDDELDALDERAARTLEAAIEAWEAAGWARKGEFTRGEYREQGDPERAGLSLDAELSIRVDTPEQLRDALDFADRQDHMLSLD